MYLFFVCREMQAVACRPRRGVCFSVVQKCLTDYYTKAKLSSWCRNEASLSWNKRSHFYKDLWNSGYNFPNFRENSCFKRSIFRENSCFKRSEITAQAIFNMKLKILLGSRDFFYFICMTARTTSSLVTYFPKSESLSCYM